MHRQKSLEPFTRHFNGQQFFDMLELSDREIGPSSTISGISALAMVNDERLK